MTGRDLGRNCAAAERGGGGEDGLVEVRNEEEDERK